MQLSGWLEGAEIYRNDCVLIHNGDECVSWKTRSALSAAGSACKECASAKESPTVQARNDHAAGGGEILKIVILIVLQFVENEQSFQQTPMETAAVTMLRSRLI